MEEDLKNFDPFFETDLKNYKIAQLSLTPGVPGKDEVINHQIISHQMLETKSGRLLLIDLKNLDTGEEYTYSYPDIQKIDVNSNSNPEFQKYYITCLNRETAFVIRELEEWLARGIPITEKEKAFLRDNDGLIKYRIMLMDKK
jgi:hypothetical protein